LALHWRLKGRGGGLPKSRLRAELARVLLN